MASSISVVTATMLGVFLASIFYGIFIVLYITSVLFWLKRSSSSRPFFTLVTSTTLFIFNTLFIALYINFVLVGVSGTENLTAYFAQTGEWKEMVVTALMLATLLLADSMLVYRCWIVWGKDWRVIVLPTFLWFAGLAIVCCAFYELVMVSGEGKTLFAPDFSRFTKATLGYTLTQNVLVISLILYKIWLCRSPNSTSSFGPVVYALLESGTLYVVSILVWLVLDVTGSNAYYVILCSIVPIVGIVFTLLLVRVGMRADDYPSRSSATQSTLVSLAMPPRRQPIVISVTDELHSEGNDFNQKHAADSIHTLSAV